MFKNIKLWKLYVFPFIVILLIISGENTTLLLDKLKSFENIAQTTNSIEEIDLKNLQKTTVTKVIDGDTIIIESGERVRYIGVDTPETVHPKKSVQCYGKAASNKNKALVEGKTIYLERDVSDKDHYDRLLRFIYLPNPNSPSEVIFVNEYLIEQGYGMVITYPPDVKYHDRFVLAQRTAQKEKRGLWGSCN